MPRKAEYTDRPLTIEEREFAAENHGLFYRYMKNMKLDPEEWYDILIVDYLQAVKKYFSNPDLQRYDFYTILFKRLDAGYQNYFKAKHAQKRMLEGGLCSLDYVIDSGNGKELHIEAWLIDKNTSIERQVINKDCFEEFWNAIDGFFWNEQMKVVASMLLEGYSQKEIIKHMWLRFDDPQFGRNLNDWDFIINQLRTAFKDVYGF